MCNASLKRKWDNKNVLDYAVKTAVAEAVADADHKAREEERTKAEKEKIGIAQKLKSQKISIEIIAEVTGLSVEEIETL